MQVKMRHAKREIKDPAHIEAILQSAQVLRLAMSVDDQPYLVPLCFGYEDGTIYLHSGPKGLKMDMLRKNPKVCFEVEGQMRTIPGESPCEWSMQYESVIGFGTAKIVNDEAERTKGLQIVSAHYAGPGEHHLLPKSVARTAVIRIDITTMTGKHNGA